jgi:hypothetical protein
MKLLITLFVLTITVHAQEYIATDIKGMVKYRQGTSEEWIELNEGTKINTDVFISTDEKSSVKILGKNNSLVLSEKSALSVASIKTMSTDELLLALAMEDMINAPKSDKNSTSKNTATYGDKENIKEVNTLPGDFGIKRLNGAMQLAKNGLEESAVVFAKETYRKYPDSKQIPHYRIFFAEILNEKGLYEEALGEYLEIDKLELDENERAVVEEKILSINKILLNN